MCGYIASDANKTFRLPKTSVGFMDYVGISIWYLTISAMAWVSAAEPDLQQYT